MLHVIQLWELGVGLGPVVLEENGHLCRRRHLAWDRLGNRAVRHGKEGLVEDHLYLASLDRLVHAYQIHLFLFDLDPVVLHGHHRESLGLAAHPYS